MLVPLPALLMLLQAPSDEVVTGRDAQVRLADVLADAESVDAVIGKRHQVTFEIVRDGNEVEAIARTQNGEVVELVLHDLGPAEDVAEDAGLSWLGDVMKETTAVTRLAVDRDGAVTLVTADGQRYMAIPGRGSGGSNAAVEARWAASWDRVR